jgi:hypothetical protein
VHAVILRTFNDNRIAEIVLDCSATAKHVLDAMDLVHIMLQLGATAAKIIKSAEIKPAPATTEDKPST